MKHYTLQMMARQKWRLGAQPKPFPGQWPTRVYFRAGKLSYLGKPNPLQVARFIEVVRQDGLQSLEDCFVEFDRSGAVYIVSLNKGTHAENLFRFYHHWQQPGEYGSHLLARLHCKRIRGYPVYSPWQTLSEEYIQEFTEFAEKFLAGKLKPEPPREKPRYAEYDRVPEEIFPPVVEQAPGLWYNAVQLAALQNPAQQGGVAAIAVEDIAQIARDYQRRAASAIPFRNLRRNRP